MASYVIALQQAINEHTVAAFDQGVRVAQF